MSYRNITLVLMSLLVWGCYNNEKSTVCCESRNSFESWDGLIDDWFYELNYANDDVFFSKKHYERLEAYFVSRGVLESTTKVGYYDFLKDYIFAHGQLDLSCIDIIIGQGYSSITFAPVDVWSSISRFDRLSKELDNNKELSDNFKNLSSALGEFYVGYSSTSNYEDLVIELKTLLSKYDDCNFEGHIIFRVFFLNLAYYYLLNEQ